MAEVKGNIAISYIKGGVLVDITDGIVSFAFGDMEVSATTPGLNNIIHTVYDGQSVPVDLTLIYNLNADLVKLSNLANIQTLDNLILLDAGNKLQYLFGNVAVQKVNLGTSDKTTSQQITVVFSSQIPVSANL